MMIPQSYGRWAKREYLNMKMLGELTGGLLHSLLKGIQATVKGVQALSLTSEEAAEVVERFREKLCELPPK